MDIGIRRNIWLRMGAGLSVRVTGPGVSRGVTCHAAHSSRPVSLSLSSLTYSDTAESKYHIAYTFEQAKKVTSHQSYEKSCCSLVQNLI